MKKLFITLEGGEGVGKSTIIKKLRTKLNKEKYKTYLTREPGGSPLAEEIRELIMNNNMSKKTELLLFSAARADHLNVIEEKLRNGYIVLCDRFTDSTRVYQTISKTFDAIAVKDEDVDMINKFTIGNRVPDVTFILDMDVEKAQHRIKTNNRDTNRFDDESLEFHKDVRNKFLELSKESLLRYKVINADRDVDIIVDEMFEYLRLILD